MFAHLLQLLYDDIEIQLSTLLPDLGIPPFPTTTDAMLPTYDKLIMSAEINATIENNIPNKTPMTTCIINHTFDNVLVHYKNGYKLLHNGTVIDDNHHMKHAIQNGLRADTLVINCTIKYGTDTEYLDTIGDSGVAICESFAASVRKILIIGMERKRFLSNNSIITCAPFATSLQILSARYSCGITDNGLRLCTNIKNLCAGNNGRITTCAPFATSLRILNAYGNCGISDNGLHACIHIENLDARYNFKITSCRTFAKSLRILNKHTISSDEAKIMYKTNKYDIRRS